MPHDDTPAATVTFYPDGPMLLRGDFVLRTPHGEAIDPRRGTVALCRCGRSGIKRFCAGSQKTAGVRAPAGADRSGPDTPRQPGGDAERSSPDTPTGPDAAPDRNARS